MKSKTTKHLFLMWVVGAIMLLTNSISLAASSGISEKNPVFDIYSKIFIDGKLIASPRIIAKANQLATISTSGKAGIRNFSMQLIANEKTENAITIKFVVKYRNGNEYVEVKPGFILRPNQEGAIKLSKSGHLFEMQVLAKKQ